MPEKNIKIEPNKRKEIAVPNSDNVNHYRFRVEQGKVRLGDSRQDSNRGTVAVPGDRARIHPEKNDTIWIRNVGINTAVVELTPQGLGIEFFPNAQVEVTSKVFPGVETDSFTASSNSQQFTFKDQQIPEGAEMYVYPASGNSGEANVEGVAPIQGGQSFAVDNMNDISFTATDSGDTFYAVVEVDQ